MIINDFLTSSYFLNTKNQLVASIIFVEPSCVLLLPLMSEAADDDRGHLADVEL